MVRSHPKAAFVGALSRALKAAGYYEPGHPVLQQSHKELLSALSLAMSEGPVRLAGLGTDLLTHASEEPLNDTFAKAIAEHLFRRSIVCLTFKSLLTAKDLGLFLQCLSQSPETLRSAGGLNGALAKMATGGVDVYEIDFETLFAGQIPALANGDSLVEKALDTLLRLKDKRPKSGTAIHVEMGHLSTPESLGGFLDEMLAAAPQSLVAAKVAGPPKTAAVKGSVGKTGAFSLGQLKNATADDLAELAAEAYSATVDQLTQNDSVGPTSLSDVARVLSGAMARIGPQARLRLLQRLSSHATFGSLADQVPDAAVVDSIRQALTGPGNSHEAAMAVGQLLRQLRPVESRRAELLKAVEPKGKANAGADALLWQALKAGAQEQAEEHRLELPFEKTLPALSAAAKSRRNTATASTETSALFESLKPPVRMARAAALMVESVSDQGPLNAALFEKAKSLIEALDVEGGASAEAIKMLGALVKRFEPLGSSNAQYQAVLSLLKGPKGALRTLALLKSSEHEGNALLVDGVLMALESSMKTEPRKELIQCLSNSGEKTSKVLRSRLTSCSAAVVGPLMTVLMRREPKRAVEMFKAAMRRQEVASKITALRNIGAGATSEIVGVLAAASGAQGDEKSKAALGLTETQISESQWVELQRAAIEALGQSQLPEAVGVLQELLSRTKLIGGKMFDAFRPDAARALAIHNTPGAQKVLTEGRNSTNKLIRTACTQASPKPSTPG